MKENKTKKIHRKIKQINCFLLSFITSVLRQQYMQLERRHDTVNTTYHRPVVKEHS
jgi:hypothetical protein